MIYVEIHIQNTEWESNDNIVWFDESYVKILEFDEKEFFIEADKDDSGYIWLQFGKGGVRVKKSLFEKKRFEYYLLQNDIEKYIKHKESKLIKNYNSTSKKT